jgi:predicted anti-sigma-YlaC factor YlaD
VNLPDEPTLDNVHALMMAALDGECTDAERRTLDAHLAQRPDLQAEWARLQRVKEVTMTMGVARPPEEFWDQFTRTPLHRSERGIAWTLIAIGVAILGVSALWAWIEAWLAADIPWVMKLASGSLAVGIALLIVSVLRERWVLSRRDPYSKEIER